MCVNPIPIRNPKKASLERFINVSCGRCIECRLNRSRIWAIRCMHESQMHKDNCFVTLTYADPCLIWGHKRPLLHPRDLEKFWKRLRKETNVELSYFACGEYGSRTHRPHYHACIFGYDFPDKKLSHTSGANRLYTSDMLDHIWGFGNCIIGDVTFDSAAYVARYIIDKKLGKTANYYEDEGITPEFVRMSRNPGIGKRWIEKFHRDIYPDDSVPLKNTRITSRPPRYYDNYLESINPSLLTQLKATRHKYSKKTPTDYYHLDARAKTVQSKLSVLKRDSI